MTKNVLFYFYFILFIYIFLSFCFPRQRWLFLIIIIYLFIFCFLGTRCLFLFLFWFMVFWFLMAIPFCYITISVMVRHLRWIGHIPITRGRILQVTLGFHSSSSCWLILLLVECLLLTFICFSLFCTLKIIRTLQYICWWFESRGYWCNIICVLLSIS